jgi:hypothetical protein
MLKTMLKISIKSFEKLPFEKNIFDRVYEKKLREI